jgi:glucuronate isomerase
MGQVGSVINSVAAAFDKFTPIGIISNQASKLLPDDMKSLAQNPFQRGALSITNPTKKFKQTFKEAGTIFDNVTGKADARAAAAAEAAQAKIDNDKLIGEVETQARTKNYNAAALANAKSAQQAARAAQQSRAGRAKSRRSAMLGSGGQNSGTTIGGSIPGYTNILGGE